MTAVVLFNRDLRVTDHPALRAAVDGADRVVPLFVLDDAILASGYAAPNRVAFLVDALRDLHGRLVERGGSLVVRRGETVAQVREVVRAVGADAIHVSSDVGAYARRREADLADLAADLGIRLERHPGVTVVPPGELSPSAGKVFKVFTPYHRRWREHRLRPVVDAPARVRLPDGLATGAVPAVDELIAGPRSPELPCGGETAALELLSRWLDDGDAAIGGYEDGHDDLAGDRTSRLSPYLHFGCVSPRAIVARLDRRRRGHDAFERQVAWRDFHHQTVWAHPTMSTAEYRPRDDRWRDDADALAAWKEGRTGYPLVDAGMRQLRREGWMHNRARLVAASFLAKHLYVDWRLGASHFLDWLVDGDVANNSANWQWVAGTGTDTRPNRILNPVSQARRHDPDGAYVRRYVEELAHLPGPDVHEPWRLEPGAAPDYPPPIVDHEAARARFLVARGAA